MNNRSKRLLIAGLGALLLASVYGPSARAGGFLVYDASGEALGKASAVTASVNEPAAVLFNPAALSHMEGYQFSLGTVWVNATSTFEDAATGDKTKAIPRKGGFWLPTIYGMARLNKYVAIGLGVYTIFGLGVEWPYDWTGRVHGIMADIETVTFSPTVSIRLHEKFSFAVGLNVVRGTVDMTNGLPAAIGGHVQIGGATFGFGAHAALLFRALPEKLHFGVTYHSRVRLAFNGKADFEPENEEFVPQLQDQGGKAVITLPDILSLGVMYRPIPKFAITFDTNVVFWSTYDELKLDFEQREDQVLKRKNKNAATFRLGFEYELPVKGLKARLGFAYDMNPARSEYMAPSLPDSHRLDVSLGLGYEWKWLKVDLGYMLVNFLDSKATGGTEGPIGTYSMRAHLTALTLTFRFGHDKKKYQPKEKDPREGYAPPPPPPTQDPRATRPTERPAERPVRQAPPATKRPRTAPPAKRKAPTPGQPAGTTDGAKKTPTPDRPAANP